MTLKRLCKTQEITLGDLADLMHIHRTTLTSWIHHKSYPTLDYVIDMAKILNVREQVVIDALKK